VDEVDGVDLVDGVDSAANILAKRKSLYGSDE
jgi:hypothetical protein